MSHSASIHDSPAGQSNVASPVSANPTTSSNTNSSGDANLPNGKGDLDVAYLKDKRIPALLESLAAEFIIHKPHDPESFLKNRFHVGSEGSLDGSGDAGIVTISTLCPLSAIVKMAVTRCSAKVNVKEVDPATGAGPSGSNGLSSTYGSFAGGSKGVVAAASSASGHLTTLNRDASAVPSSPFGKTPCLEHNGLVVLEVGPVVRYLCHGTPYLPSTLRPRVKAEVAFDLVVANVLPHAMTAVNEKYVVPRVTNRPVDAIAIQQAASKFRSDLVQLLQGNAKSSGAATFFTESVWVAGREPSIADMALTAGVFAVQSVGGYDCITGLAAVEKWWEAVRQEHWFTKGLGDWQSLAVSLHTR